MKILDLGCTDGYISAWLRRQMPNVECYGIELDPDQAAVARRRGVDCRVGRAEDAPKFFDVEFDAVIAFELLEHVSDVEELLDAAEECCRPGGRVYLSTPSGTFAEGQNPEHLRVLRSLDLFDLMRRRGEIVDMLDGPDGVVVGAYVPFLDGPRDWEKEVAIWTGPGWQKWHPMDIDSKGLGGSETAASRLADELVKMGYTVTLYGDFEEEGAWGQVGIRKWEAFDASVRRKAVIVSRRPEMFDRWINADAKIFWMHDTDYGSELTPLRASKMDKIMVLSDWHRKHVLGLYPFTESLLQVTRNGIHPDYFEVENEELERNPHRAIFSSSPDRGLDILLEVWPKVREQVPDAELYYCYSDVYDAVAKQRPEVMDFRRRVNELANQEGVVNLGSLPQGALAFAMREAGVWVAPSYYTPGGVRFHETYCIGAVEAAAAGCHIVASNWGALPERMSTAGSMELIDSNEDGTVDSEAFAEAIVCAMKQDWWPGPSELALCCTWEGVAQDFQDVIGRVPVPTA